MANLPENITFSINATAPTLPTAPKVTGGLTITWVKPLGGFSSLEIKRNGISQVTGYTGIQWGDDQWHEDNFYEIIATDTSDSSTESTDLLYFPYYPTYVEDGSGYYRDAFVVGSEILNQFVLGQDNPMRRIKHKIRHDIELQMLEGGLLPFLQSTNSGMLDLRDLTLQKYPAASIQIVQTSETFINTADTDENHNFNINVFGISLDPYDMLKKVEDTIYWISQMAVVKNEWDNFLGIYATNNITPQYPNAASRIADTNRFEIEGNISFTILARRAWRD